MVQVELSLHATKLKNVAGAFKGTSDPFAVVTKIATKQGESPQVLGKTEVIKNSLNPEWAKVFVFDYDLGTPTKVAVSIFDEVQKGDNKSMGAAIFDIGELLGARGGTKAAKIRGGGMLYAQIRKSEGSGVLRLKLQGINLKNTEGFLRKSDPFFELCRKVDAAGGQTWDNVFRSNVVKNNLSPQWDEAVIELSVLCGGNRDLPIMVKVFDYEKSGKHVFIGQYETNVKGLSEAASSNLKFELKANGKPTGSIVVSKADVSGGQTMGGPQPSIENRVTAMSITPSTPPPSPQQQVNFVDYIRGGCELNVVVAIDFTGSNGDPRKPGTLHYFHKDGSLNDYEKAIKSILGILANFDTDKKFPVLGFGAKYDGVIRHAFQCGSTSEACGVDGVLQAYHDVFKSGLIMSGPTVFNEVIQNAAARAESSLQAARQIGKQTYTILLILTDGCVSDIPSTASCLERFQDTPLSIVIVGVGNADFSDMNFLDDLHEPGMRDIVQFVPFNQYSRHPADLSAATLHEIPDQLVSYFKRKGIQPGAAISVKMGDIIVEEEQEIDLSLDISEEEIVVSAGGTSLHSW